MLSRLFSPIFQFLLLTDPEPCQCLTPQDLVVLPPWLSLLGELDFEVDLGRAVGVAADAAAAAATPLFTGLLIGPPPFESEDLLAAAACVEFGFFSAPRSLDEMDQKYCISVATRHVISYSSLRSSCC